MNWKWLFAVGVAWGCTCSAPRPACELFDGAPVVFTGTIMDGNISPKGPMAAWGVYLVQVDVALKGLGAGQREVFVDPDSFTSCSRRFETGRTYLFFAYGDGKASMWQRRSVWPERWSSRVGLPFYHSGQCDGSRLLEDAKSDLEWIRARLRGETRTRISGATFQNYGRHWWGDANVPLPGARVFLRDGNHLLSTTAGADGRFAFENVVPGKYGLHAELAPWEGARREDVAVANGGCVERTLSLRSRGELGGVVRGAGAGVEVELVRVLEDGSLAGLPTLWTHTDAAGKFRMEEVPAGRFVLGVNVASPMTAGRSYGMSRVPGVLELEPNGVVSGLTFDLQAARPVRTVRVRVFWADGREVKSGAGVSAVPVGYAERFRMARGGQEGNVVTIRMMEEYSYQVSAYWSSGGDRVESAEVILPEGKGDRVLDVRLEGVR